MMHYLLSLYEDALYLCDLNIAREELIFKIQVNIGFDKARFKNDEFCFWVTGLKNQNQNNHRFDVDP